MANSKLQKSSGNRPKPPNAGKGRKKGVPNKTTALLKDAILQAAERAGDKEGMIGYLTVQAQKNPNAFLGLLGKVLPMQVTGPDDGPIRVTEIKIVGPDGSGDDGNAKN
jgi:hypothetical protein